jgi:hypothetical protein
MPYTIKFKKLMKSTKKTYGPKKGKSIAFAIARKKGWRT